MLKVEYQNYLITQHSDLSEENREYMVDVFEDWVNDGNVEEWEDGYIEQTTQWRKKFTAKSLIDFYIREYDVI